MSNSELATFPYEGGCACNAIRYQVSDKPLAMFNCHCTDCQRASGGSFVTVGLIRDASLKMLKGAPKYYRCIGESGRWTDRGFCADCGTPLFAKGEVAPGYISIKPGSLDDASWFRPTIDTWAPRAPDWLPLSSEIPKSDKTPNLLRGPKAAAEKQ